MKIPKLFKKAAAFVMAAVTALSIMPATAFAAHRRGGDKGVRADPHAHPQSAGHHAPAHDAAVGRARRRC